MEGIIIGTFLGFALSQLGHYIKEKRVDKRQKQSVRKIINLEVEHNIKLLKEYFEMLNTMNEQERDEASKNIANEPIIKSYKFISSSPPQWSHIMWESQMMYLSLALNDEKILRIHRFHTKLDRINKIYNEFIKLHEEHKDLLEKTGSLPNPKKIWFLLQKDSEKNDRVIKLWSEILDIYYSIDNNVNPVKLK